MGGLLGGLAAASLPVQSGQLAGQIQGKEMGMQYQIQLANLMREQALAQSEMAKNQAQADAWSGKNQTLLGVQGLKNTGADRRERAGRAEHGPVKRSRRPSPRGRNRSPRRSTNAKAQIAAKVNASAPDIARNENQRQGLMLEILTVMGQQPAGAVPDDPRR